MPTSSVVEIHAALGYTEADAATLKKVKRIWQKLESYRLRAEKGDGQALRSYSDLLSKSLVSARHVRAVEDVEAVSMSFWAWYGQECADLKIHATELARGSDHMTWCEKWLPEVYKAFSDAIDRTVDLPSQQNFDEAKVAGAKMLRAYVEAFEKG